MPSVRDPRFLTLAGGSLCLGVLLVQVAAVWPFTVDDTYITLRYARHLAEGAGPVYQAEGPRAEGYTSFLWMALLAVPHGLRLDAALAAKVLGALAAMALLLVTFLFTRSAVESEGDVVRAGEPARLGTREGLGAASLAGWLAAFGLACYPPTAVHAVSGMETAPFALALTGLLAACGLVVQNGGRWSLALGPAALAVGLLRPEGNLAAVLALATTLALAAKSHRARIATSALLGYVLPGALYFAWRWGYYGEVLPLPYYLKVGNPQGFPGAARVAGFLAGLLVPAGLLASLALIRPARVLWPAIAAILGLAGFFLLPDHFMGYHGRYLFPASPVLFALAGIGAARLAGWLATRQGWTPGRARILSWGTAALLAATSLANDPRVAADRRLYATGLARAHESLGRQLAALPRGTLAIADAGAVPYLSGWRTIDLFGLNDRHIATTGDRSPGYVLAQGPDLVVLASASSERFTPFFWNRWEEGLYQACRGEGMVRLGCYPFHERYYLWVMGRPGSRHAGRAPGPLPVSSR